MRDAIDTKRESPPAFDVDGMLGRVAKWLRILGIDAAFPCSVPSQGRFFVTTRKGTQPPGIVRIAAGTVEEQLKEVLDRTGVEPDPDLLFSRCLICNVPVREVPRAGVERKVPVAVFSMTSTFHECPNCGRVYWEGTHESRVRRRLERMDIVAMGKSGLEDGTREV